MEIDLYQRRGMYGLGVVDPVTGIDTSTGLVAAPPTPSVDLTSLTSGVSSSVSSLASGLDLSSMSPTTLLVVGAAGLWLLSSLFSGTKRTYEKIARPIKRRRRRKQELEEAEEGYRAKRRRIERTYSK